MPMTKLEILKLARDILQTSNFDSQEYYVSKYLLETVATLEFYANMDNYDMESGAVIGTTTRWGKDWPSMDYGDKARQALGIEDPEIEGGLL